MKSTILLTTFAILAGTIMTTNVVQAEVSANVGMTTDYRFRGITQTANAFAIQGGLDYSNDSGFHAGVWSSNVDFQIQTVGDASTELDIYAGYGGDVGDSGVSWDIGFLHYSYPSSDDSLNYNFTEINGTLSYEWMTFFYAHSNDYFAGSGTSDYYNVAADVEFDGGWSAGASIAYQAVDDNAAWGTPDWNEYKVYFGNSFAGLDVEFALIGTDLSESECFGGSDWCDDTATISISKSF